MMLIHPDARKHYKCSVCGTNQSVKYLIEVNDSYGNAITIPCCNKCVLAAKRRGTVYVKLDRN